MKVGENMQNFIKQIISAIKFWVTEKINVIEEKLKDSTADWAVNDEANNAYIKNRPFYSNYKDIATDEITGNYSGGYNWFEYDGSQIIEPYWVEGQSVVVTWNGKDYPCTVK